MIYINDLPNLMVDDDNAEYSSELVNFADDTNNLLTAPFLELTMDRTK